MFSSARPSAPRRVAACALGLALVAGPAVAGGTTGSAAADAASLHRAKATATARATVTARRTAAATVKATVVATVPGGVVAPIRVTMSASASRTAVSAATSARRKTVTARAATKARAKARAKALARKSARSLARKAAAGRAASAASAKARTAANGAARAAAIRLANAKAIAEAKQAAPGSSPSTGVVSVSPVAAPCGGVTPARAAGGRYTTCTFDDDFTGGTLDPSKWTAMDSTTSGAPPVGDECFRPGNVSTSGGALQLTGTKSATPITCAKKQRQYMSGQVTTKGLFSQTYGRFEMRAKFPKDAGYVSGFWMLPENPLADGYTKYKYGEIDIVENWALHPELAWAHLHYVLTPGTLMSGKSCATAGDDNFHTYAVDWSATSMSFLYDGNTCWTTTWRPVYPYAPAGSSAPTPFDQPFYMILNLSLGASGSTSTKPLSQTPMGKSLQVDWVRAWK